MAFHIRRLEPIEAPLLRQLRIAALQDAPDQFAETVAHALARSEQEWIEFAACAYVAESKNAFVGLVFAFEDASDDAVGRVGGMWVAGGARRTGIGSALVEAALSWAKAAGKRRVRLWAVPTSPAERLYRRAHFVPTGNQKQFPGDDTRVVIEMEIELRGAANS
jgi:GNAT superfamily N-acetyltransferase